MRQGKWLCVWGRVVMTMIDVTTQVIHVYVYLYIQYVYILCITFWNHLECSGHIYHSHHHPLLMTT